MPTYINSGSWKQVKEIYVRANDAWKAVRSAWVRVGNVWKQVHNVVETPYPSGDITVRNSLNDIIDNSTYLANVGDTIYGNRGPTWLNNPTAFQYRWRYSTESGGPYQDFSPAETSTSHPSLLNTASPISRINEWDGRWIVYEVRAQNALGYSEWFTSINEAHLVKYKPVNRSISITGTPGPFSTLTAENVWQTTLINTGDWAPSTFEYNWYDNTTNELIYTDTVRTFTPTIEDLNRYVRVEVTATNTGGSTTAVSAAVGPIEFVLAVETPTVTQDNGDIALDNRGGIINGIFIKVSATIYGVTEYTSYRVRYRYRNLQTGVYLLYGASSTATASWVTRTANPSGFGNITNVDVDDVNRVTNLQDVSYIDPIWYDGSTYTAGAITNGPRYQVEIQVSVVRTDNSTVSRTLIYGISAAPVPTITATPSTVGTGRDVVISGTIGGIAGKPAYPIEVFLDFGDGNVDTQLFSEGDRNPTYSITYQYEYVDTYTAEVSTNPPFTSATKSITVILSPGSFNIISVVKGLSNGTTRPVTVTWEQSTNATAYEVQIQRQFSGLTGWVTVQTFDASTYTFEPTRTETFNVSPVAKYYQVSVRATRFADLDTAAYSDGGTLASPVYVEAVGIPAGAPTSLSVSDIRTTSATISFTAPTSFGSAGLNTYQWSLDNITWNSTFSSTSPAYVYGLTADTSTTVYIRALNLDDTGGTPASITFTTAAGPKPFNIISATKGIYDPNLARSIGAGNSYPGNGARAITINWSQSLDATQYEVQIEARDYDPIVFLGASQTWVMLRSLDLAPYVNEPTRTETFNAAWYWQYRVTVRARTSGNLASAAYSDGGSSTSLVYFDVTGTAPGKPTIGTITPTKNSASVPFTNSTSTGSSDLAFSQWSLDQANWTRVDTSPFTITNLESSFFYTVYMRSFNYDGISSATPHAFKSFTTPAAKPPNTPTSPTTSGVTSTNITFSWTAPSTDATHGAATSYIYYTNTTGSTPSSGGTSVSAPTTSINFTYTASASPITRYFWVRAVNDDGESSLTTVVSATPSGLPSNSVAPGISTDTGNYSAGSIITGTTGTWSNAASYLIEIARSTSTPITSDSALVSNVYTITDTDAADPSFYFAVKVTAYSGAGQTGSSVVAYSATSPISTLVPTVSTPTLGTATKTGFTVTWTSGPLNRHTSNVQIYNASQTLLTTISGVTSPYVWTGASVNTTYYVKVRVIAQDTSATSVTSGFSDSITTLPNAPVNTATPTITPTSGFVGTTTYSVDSNGTWNNSPTSFEYQWQSFDQGSVYISIAGATSSSYSPPSDFFTSKISPIRCRVTAINAGGSAAAFSNTAAVSAVTVPGQVTGVTATVTSLNRPYNDGEIGVSWTAPANNGGRTITGYFVEYSSNGGTSWSTLSANWTSGTSLGSSPWGVATYIFRVSAINSVGTGTASANSNNAVVTTVPEAPTIGTATAGSASATVAYTAGATGGKTATYTATSSPGGFTGTGASPITVSGLTNGTAYTFTVKATNDNGTSNSSLASNSVTPVATPTAPTALSADVVSGDIVLTFSGGVGDQYDYYYANDAVRPTDGQALVDAANITSPYTTGLTGRGTTRYFYIRKSTGTLRSAWFPAAGTQVTARIPLLAPPAPVITNSAQATTSLSWHWTKPTPSASQDQADSWDYKIDQSASDPTSGLTNTTTQPTSAAPLVTSSLSSNTTYYLHVRAKNADASSVWVTLSATTTASFVTPTWTGTMPTWAATGANGSNFQRINSPTASRALKYGWNNGTFTFSGSVGTSKGWDFYVSGTEPANTSTARTPTNTLDFNTTALSPADPVYSTNFLYRVSPTWNVNPRFGSIRPYQFGTDGNKYVRSTWSVSI